MKIRQGFVSNSSSSSFIVAFPADMEMTKENIKQYVFGSSENIYDPYGSNHVSTESAAEIIAREAAGQTPNDHDSISDAMQGHVPGCPNYSQFKIMTDGRQNYDWEAHQAACDKFQDEVLNNFIGEHQGMKLYVFEYSDNDGSMFCTMEHGGTFEKVPHICISNH